MGIGLEGTVVDPKVVLVTKRWKSTVTIRHQKPVKRPCLGDHGVAGLVSSSAHVAPGSRRPESSNARGRSSTNVALPFVRTKRSERYGKWLYMPSKLVDIGILAYVF